MWKSGIVIALSIVAPLVRAADAPPATQPAPAAMTQFDPNPHHLWNRLRTAILVRTTLTGLLVDDDLFPYLWDHSRYLLEGPSHDAALRVMDEFLATNGEKLIADPARRLMLQRDLWTVFDWCAWVPDDWVYLKKDEPAAKALRWRLAKIIQRLALNAREIAALPDNYRAAVQSHSFPSQYDSAQREQPFFPADLFDKDSPWVCIDLHREHAEAVHDRSIFLVLMQLPGGKQATGEYIQSLAHDPRQFPVGTKVALLRQALAIDESGHVVATHMTESLQVRVYREVPQGFDPFDHDHAIRDAGAWQDCHEFLLNRRDWFQRGHGLRAASPDDVSLIPNFDRRGSDPFEEAMIASPPHPAPATAPPRTLRTCIECHQSPGAYSVPSLSLFMYRKKGSEREPIFPKSVAMAKEQAAQLKSRRPDWMMLQGMLEAYRSP